MTDPLEMLFDVLALVGDAGRCDDGILKNFKTDFATDVVGHFTLSTTLINFRK